MKNIFTHGQAPVQNQICNERLIRCAFITHSPHLRFTLYLGSFKFASKCGNYFPSPIRNSNSCALSKGNASFEYFRGKNRQVTGYISVEPPNLSSNFDKISFHFYVCHTYYVCYNRYIYVCVYLSLTCTLKHRVL